MAERSPDPDDYEEINPFEATCRECRMVTPWFGKTQPDHKRNCLVGKREAEYRYSRVMSVQQAARQRGCTTKYVYDLLAAGRLPGATKVGRVWRIPVTALKDKGD